MYGLANNGLTAHSPRSLPFPFDLPFTVGSEDYQEGVPLVKVGCMGRLPAAVLSIRKDPADAIHVRFDAGLGSAHRKPVRAGLAAKRSGAPHLSYRLKLKEKGCKEAGHGGLPKGKRFGKYAKNTIKYACSVLEREYGKRCVFATVTIPGQGIEVSRAVAMWSGYLAQLINQWIRYVAPNSEYCWVYEWQKRGMLHLHYALGDFELTELRRLEREWRGAIHRVLCTVSKRSGVDLFSREDGGTWHGQLGVLRSNCRPVRKSVRNYMSKYLTKGSGSGAHFAPSSWWGAVTSLRRRVAQSWKADWITSSSHDAMCDLAASLRSLCKSFPITNYDWSHRMSAHGYGMVMYPLERDAEPLYATLVSAANEWWAALDDSLPHTPAAPKLLTRASPRAIIGAIEPISQT